MPYAFGARRLDPRMVPTRPVRLDRGNAFARNNVGLWLLGPNLLDYSGFGNFAYLNETTPADNPVVAGSSQGPALKFSGAQNIATISPNSPVPSSAAGLTVAVWVIPAVTTRGDLVTVWSSGTGDSQFDLLYSGASSLAAQLYVSTGGGSPSTGSSGASSILLSETTANFVVGSYDGSTAAVYVNGQLGASASVSLTLGSGVGQPVWFGNNTVGGAGAGPYTGILWAPMLWARALSALEIAELYAEPFGMLEDATPRLWFPVSSGTGTLIGTAAATSAASGVLAGAGALTGTAAAASTATATLAGAGLLTGAAAGASTATGTLAGSGLLTGTAAATSTATGTLSSGANLVGTAAATSTATGTLAGAGALTGTAAATSTATGTLSSGAYLVGTAAATSTATGTLAGAGALAGTATATTTATAALAGQGTLTGTTAATSTATGTLVTATSLVGRADATSTATGSMVGAGAMTGAAVATSAATGTLIGFGPIAGIAAATSTATGTLASRSWVFTKGRIVYIPADVRTVL